MGSERKKNYPKTTHTNTHTHMHSHSHTWTNADILSQCQIHKQEHCRMQRTQNRMEREKDKWTKKEKKKKCENKMYNYVSNVGCLIA